MAKYMHEKCFYRGLMSFFCTDGYPQVQKLHLYFQSMMVERSWNMLVFCHHGWSPLQQGYRILNEVVGFPWSKERFGVHHVTQRDSLSFSHAEVIELSKVMSTSLAKVWKDMSLGNAMEAMDGYSTAFKSCSTAYSLSMQGRRIFLTARNRPITVRQEAARHVGNTSASRADHQDQGSI